MNSVQQIVREGYQALASRVLTIIDKGKMISPHPLGQEAISGSRKKLEELAVSGEIRNIGDEGMEHFTLLSGILDLSIHPGLRPITADAILGICMNFLGAFFNLNPSELEKKLNLEKAIANPEIDGVQIGMGRDGKTKNYLFLYVTENCPSFSVYSTVRNLCLLLQPERDEMLSLLSQQRVAGYERLQGRLLNDPKLKNLESSLGGIVHGATLLKRPEVLKIALEEGLDVDAFARTLIDIGPKMNFLSCYATGGAYFKAIEVIQKGLLLSGLKESSTFYSLIGYLYALRSPLLKKSGAVSEVGVGMCSYFLEHPDTLRLLKDSREFHEELTSTYFQPRDAC